jgi:hypothetical protein
MTNRTRAVLISRVKTVKNIEDLRRRISDIEGVVSVDFNHLTQKLLVRYEGESPRIQHIEQRIRKTLGGESGNTDN